jgi:hypothetical protein
MTTYDYGAPATPHGSAPGADGEGSVKDQAQHAASTAADESRHVAEVAGQEARSVATDAKQEAADLLGETRRQLQEQSRTQLDNLVGTLQGFASDLEGMARGEGAGSGMARDLVSQVGEKARQLSGQLSGREPSDVLDQARDFARRRPGTFLLGALAAGVVAGRLARGATTHQDSGQQPGRQPGYDAATGTAAGAPLAGTDTPAQPPVYPEGTTPGGAL